MSSWVQEFRSVLIKAGGTQLATGKSIIDALGADGTTITDVGLYGGIKDLLYDNAISISNQLGGWDGDADAEGNIKDALGVTIGGGSVTTQITAVQGDITAIKTKTDNLPADTAQELTDIDSAIAALPTAVGVADAVWDEDLDPGRTTVGSAGKALLDVENYTDILDDGTNGNIAIKTAIDNVQSTVDNIQNNTRVTTSIPDAVEIPETGADYVKVFVNLYDNAGAKEDPDSSDVAVILTQQDGTDLTSARLFKDGDGTDTALSASTEFSGPGKLEKDSVGRYFCFYKSASTHTEENLNWQLKYKEATVENGRDVGMRVTDSLGDIETDIAAIKVKTDELPADTAQELNDIDTAISNPNNISAAEVSAEVDTALADINLDHLAKVPTAAADMTAEVTDGTILSRILSATADTSTFVSATDSLEAIANAIAAISSGTETKPSAADPINVTVTTSETTLWDKRASGHLYVLEHLRLKAATITNPDVMTIRLYEEVNDVETEVNSFEIKSQNFATYFTLMDMWGVDNVQGEIIKITGQMSANSVAVTGQAQHTDFTL